MTTKLSAFAALFAPSKIVDRRVQPRKKAFWPTTIASRDGESRLYLLDVTTHGARGYAVEPPRAGMICELVLYDQQVSAEIVWVNYRSFGLRFLNPISAELVEKLSA